MNKHDWAFFISHQHLRLRRLWQSFFAGWGIVFTIALIASPFIFKNISWILLDEFDMQSIIQNNLSVENLKLNGTTQNGEHFLVMATKSLQTYEKPNIIYFTNPIADTVRLQNGEKITDHITANFGRLLLNSKKIILYENVKITSSDGSDTETNEMEINLQ